MSVRRVGEAAAEILPKSWPLYATEGNAVDMRALSCGPRSFAQLALSFLAVVMATSGCAEAFGNDNPHEPGDELGTFHFAAKQAKNSCGEGALGASSTWELDVKLAWAEGQIFWDSGGQVLTGTLSEDRKKFEIVAGVTVDMRTEADAGLPPCSVARTDTAEGTLTLEGEGVSAAKGSLLYEFDPTQDSSCGDLVSSETPLFAALPCSIKYSFSAKRVDE